MMYILEIYIVCDAILKSKTVSIMQHKQRRAYKIHMYKNMVNGKNGC